MDLGRTDLQFILQQIELTEQHIGAIRSYEAVHGTGSATPAIKAALLLPLLGGDPLNPAGLRTVDGSLNNLLRVNDGAAGQPFARLLTAPANPAYPAPLPAQRVVDPEPRQISNLIADQTSANPAASAASVASGGSVARWQGITVITADGGSVRYSDAAQAYQDQVLVQASGKPPGVLVDPSGQLLDLSGQLLDEQGEVILTIPSSVAAGEPFNAWTTLFGQGFDHGLDFLTKGGQGTVVIPLQPDDPLFVPGSRTNFMVLERAQQGLANQVTPWVDMNQAYASHPSLQVFLREYTRVTDPSSSSGFRSVPTGRLLSGLQGGVPAWADVQRNAAEFLGIELTDAWVGNSPYVLVDDYGNFIPASDGLAQVWMTQSNGTVAPVSQRVVVAGASQPLLQLGTPGGAPGSAAVTNHAFLLDIAHTAQPGFVDPDRDPATNNSVLRTADTDTFIGNPLPSPNAFGVQTVYDDELLRAHYVAGDGRVNENSGLIAFHSIFHAEHDRLVSDYKRILISDAQQSGDVSFLNQWLLPQSQLQDASGLQGVDPQIPTSANLIWNGERLFQAGRFLVEMQYQHGVFEEFARTLQPNLPLFNGPTQAIDPAITAEFAHAVYRFGHSMLTESLDRFTPDWQNTSTGLIDAFLDPVGFTRAGELSSTQATGEILRGSTRQVSNEIDEFTTGSLRNNLVGLPLDLAAINIARGRDVNLPKLNDSRRQLSQQPGAVGIQPYSSWGLPQLQGSVSSDSASFASQLRQPLSLINFVAAYGTHPVLQSATTTEARREAAVLLLTGLTDLDATTLSDGTVVTQDVLQDRLDFWNGTGVYAADLGGLENVDLWIGGLAEKPNANDGSRLGSTFAYVFEKTLLNLQSTDRFYYLDRLALQGNLLAQVESNSFASMAVRNSDVKHLPGVVFTLPAWFLESNPSLQFNASLVGEPLADPVGVNRDPASVGASGDPALNPAATLRYSGNDGAVLGGTDQADLLQAVDGTNTFWGDGGDDYLFAGRGNDQVFAGDGNDIVIDSGNDGAIGDVIRGEAGHDVIKLTTGPGAVHGGTGSDLVMGGMGFPVIFGDSGQDFLQSGSGLGPVLGGIGDDWLEGAPQGSDLFGESGAPPLIDPVSLLPLSTGQEVGNDVLVSIDGASASSGDLGDDIHLNGLAADRFAGGGGFDWSTAPRQSQLGQGLVAWLQAGAPNLLVPPAVIDRFDQHVEALSGSSLNDTLTGDERVDLSSVGALQAGLDDRLIVNPLNPLITGLQDLLPQGSFSVADNGYLVFSEGNILLGGAGADDLAGLGGNDVIDGDLGLRVQLTLSTTGERFNSMNEVNQAVLNRFVSPADMRIVRELVREDSNASDRALFRGRPEQYRIEGLQLVGTQPVLALNSSFPNDGDGWLRIVHDTPLSISDGADFLRNIEFLVFQNDQADTNVDGIVDPSDWTIVDLRSASASSPALASYLSGFQSSDAIQPALDLSQPQPITLTASQEIITDLIATPSTSPALVIAAGAVTDALAALPSIQRAELPPPSSPGSSTTATNSPVSAPPDTIATPPSSSLPTPSEPVFPSPVNPPTSSPDATAPLQARLLTSASSLIGELRHITSSLRQLTFTAPEPELVAAPSRPVTPSPASFSPISSRNDPDDNLSPVPRVLSTVSQSLAQMRPLLAELQAIDYSVPAISVPPAPIAPQSTPPFVSEVTPVSPVVNELVVDPSISSVDPQPSLQPTSPPLVQTPTSPDIVGILDASVPLALAQSLIQSELRGTSLQAASSATVPPSPSLLTDLATPDDSLPNPISVRGRLIESSGDLTLYKVGRRRYEVDFGGVPDSVELKTNRRSLQGFRAFGVEAHEDGIQLIMRRQDRFASALFNLDGDMLSLEKLKTAQVRTLEPRFDQDLDRNGTIDRLVTSPELLRSGLSSFDHSRRVSFVDDAEIATVAQDMSLSTSLSASS